MAIADLRREYALGGLRRGDLAPDPITQFQSWLKQAAGARGTSRLRRFLVSLYKSFLLLGGAPAPDVTAMTLATVDAEGRPSARVVLLKGVDERGFVFFTNYESRKGQELAANPLGALVFYWTDFEREVCVAGEVKKLPEGESDAYFGSRPRGSCIAAWASDQSRVVKDRGELEQKWLEQEARFSGRAVPRPPHWGGYLLVPNRIEFWQGRPSRLHDRFRYTRQADNSWSIERLAP